MPKRVQTAAFIFGIVLAALLGTRPSQAQGSPSRPGQPMPNSADAPVGGMSQSQTTRPSAPAGPLKITFAGKSSEWTPTTLAALPHKTVTVYNEHAKANQTYSGVELIELLKPLGIPEKPRGKDFRLYLVAEGSDGYQVVYSIGEVTPDVHEATVLVADSLDGKPIANSGPLQLVATAEKRPARWVRNLVAIRIQSTE